MLTTSTGTTSSTLNTILLLSLLSGTGTFGCPTAACPGAFGTSAAFCVPLSMLSALGGVGGLSAIASQPGIGFGALGVGGLSPFGVPGFGGFGAPGFGGSGGI